MPSHCYFTIFKHRKKGPPALLVIHRHPKQKGILEGRTNGAQPTRSLQKNCQNGTFLPLHGLWIFFEPNDFIWSALKVWFSDFIQNLFQAPSKCLSKHKSGDKMDYLKNPLQNFKNYLCSRVLWIPTDSGWQN